MDVITKIKTQLREQFLADNRPWVITFSGGKDSTLVLLLVIEMLLEFKNQRIKTKPVIIVSSNTKVEMPIATAYVHNKLKQLENFVKLNNLNVTVKLLVPEVEDDFFVCMLGRGYASPNSQFRWCTERLKIRPATDYLTNLAEKHQSIILLLGSRFDESKARAESIEKREVNTRDLTIHESIPNAYCYTPIKDISTQELWEYLSKNDAEAPWGTHKDMMELYDKGSGEADCNIALNPYSASCGKTRLGCWVCTVVEKDSSMEGMVKNSEYSWMKPLNDFRNKIFDYRYNHSKRRDKVKNGKPFAGAFFLEIRKELLKDLFEAEKMIQVEMAELGLTGKLISDEQLLAINNFHKMDGDYSNDALKIANHYGRNFIVDPIDSTLVTICNLTGIDAEFFTEARDLNLAHRHSLRRIGIANSQKDLITRYAQGIVHEDK